MDKHNERNPSQLEDELKELENAMPLKGGSATLLLNCAALTLFTFAFGIEIHRVCNAILKNSQIDPLEMPIAIVITLTLCAFTFRFMHQAVTVGIRQTSAVKWLKAYLQRNVRGNTAVISLINDQLSIRIFCGTSLEEPDLPEGGIAIAVPLGGWNNRPMDPAVAWPKGCVILYGPYGGELVLNKWEVRINGINLDHRWCVLMLQDHEGAKIYIEVDHLLSILSKTYDFEHPMSNTGTIRGILDYLYISESTLRSELKKVRSTHAELDSKLSTALDTLFAESQALKDTSRVGKSKEGRAIRERMEAILLELLLKDDSRRQVIAPKTEVASS
jgi:hypothetical protein